MQETRDSEYELTVSSDNANYLDGNTDKTINGKIIILNTETEYRSGNFTFKLVDIDNNDAPIANKPLKYTILTGGINTAGTITTDENGIALLDNKHLNIYVTNDGAIQGKAIPVGNQAFTIESNDTSVICPKVESTLTITKATIKIAVNNYKEYYASGIPVVINVTNAKTGEPMNGIVVHSYIENTAEKDVYLTTNANGICKINVNGLSVGTYNIVINNNDAANMENTIVTDFITILSIPDEPNTDKKSTAKITVSKLTTVYKSGKNWSIKLRDTTNNKAIANAKITLKVYTGKKYKTYTVKTNANGVATFKASTLNKGTHKVILSMSHEGYTCKPVTSSIKINAKKLYIVGETRTLKDCGQLILGAYDKQNDKLISGIKIQIKIFTGKKYKTFNLVTKKSNILKEILILIETNKFSTGTHKVTAKITTPNYTGSESGVIVIPKSAKKYKPFTFVITNGKGKYVK